MEKYPIRFSLSPSVRYEWMRKEEGSYEDHGKPKSGHVYCILCDNYKNGKLIINNEEEARIVSKSASYQTSWDAGESAIVDRLMKKAGEIFRSL